MFDTLYQEFIYKRTYARWIDSENRREDWNETVDRYKDFFISWIDKPIIGIEADNFWVSTYSIGYCF